MPYPKVFIQVLNYNGTGLTARCVQSLLALDYPEKTITIIDNGSTDRSFIELKELFPDLSFIENGRNLGFGAGHNVGVRQARIQGADYVWLVNQDAWVEPDSLSRLIETCQPDPSIGMASPLVLNPDRSVWFAGGHIRWVRMRTVHEHQPVRTDRSYETETISGCAPLLSLAAIGQAGLFDERYFLYYEDADLSARFRRAGFRLIIEPRAVVFHAEKSNTNNPEKLYWLVRSGLQFFGCQTPSLWRLPQRIFLGVRRAWNVFESWLFPRSRKVQEVARAYRDAIL